MGKIIVFADQDYSSVSAGVVRSSIVISDFVRNPGYFYNLLDEEPQVNNEYFYTIIDIPQGMTTVKCRFIKSTGGGLGMEFRDANGDKISSFANMDEVRGTLIELTIPQGATQLVQSYMTDSAATSAKVPLFGSFMFYR